VKHPLLTTHGFTHGFRIFKIASVNFHVVHDGGWKSIKVATVVSAVISNKNTDLMPGLHKCFHQVATDKACCTCD
jgi:hypothetical protein